LFVGSRLQSLSFIFDTGSGWTWAPTSACPKTQCTKNRFDYRVSKNFKNSSDTEIVNYGIGSIKGWVVNDDIAIKQNINFTAYGVNFLGIYEAVALQSLETDGLLGLSPMSYRKGNSGE
jgi:hypothetical protein